MTSNKSTVCTVEHEGVICKSDAGLYRERYGKELHFLSIYGAPQQTKAIFSALAASKELLIGEDEFQRPRDALRFRGFSLGYGKHHGIIWTDQLDVSLIVWSSDEEKRSRLRNILSRRRIPYDPQHFSRLEKLLVDHGYLTALDGWGTIGGYACDFDDDAICDLIIAEVYRSKTRKVA
jgi:hypothetical protein